jgi:type IV secretory pathway VirB10-like protein
MIGLTDMAGRVRAAYEALDARGRSLVWAGGVAALFAGAGIFSARPPEALPEKKVEPAAVSRPENAYFLGEEVDRKAHMQRLEAQYFEVLKKQQALAERLDAAQERLAELGRARSADGEAAAGLEQRVAEAVRRELAAPAVPGERGPVDLKGYQMQIINVNPVKAVRPDVVYLPAGSFVRATLLTGVYAPAEAANPLPVLIRLNEAFYGPNDRRIPLEGAFAIGKATGDLASERALVQITTMVAVLPTGTTFEHKGNIGYLTDAGGQLGLRGEVVRNTGGQLGMSFMTGFMGGASQAMADAQTTTVTTEGGHAARNVTGSRSRNAAFQGLAQSASQMSKYYEDQLEKIVPAVRVEAGADVYLVILEGVEVHGLKNDDHRGPGFID